MLRPLARDTDTANRSTSLPLSRLAILAFATATILTIVLESPVFMILGVARFLGRCCVNIRLASRSTTHQTSSSIALVRKGSRLQNYVVRSVAARTMAAASNDGSASNAGLSSFPHKGFNRARGRGRPESHREERSVRSRPRRDEYRYWLSARNKPPKDYERFVIVSYNILADVNARRHWKELYWHIPQYKWPYILDWDARKRKILWELGLWSPDIICLQEVDHYEDLNEDLQKVGYVGVYAGRTGDTSDGCAMFWRKNRFELLEEKSIEFIDYNLRDNVAQLCVLQAKSNNLKHNDSEDLEVTHGSESTTSGNNRVVVGNIHVLFNPKRGDVKLGQTRLLMEKAHAISERWGKAPVAIAGDFNSTPDSALYRFISSSQLDLAAHDRRYISGQAEESANGFRTNGYSNGGSKYERYGTASRSTQGAETGADEESAPESTVVSVKTNDFEESTVVTTGDENSVTEISYEKTTRETLKRVSIPTRIRSWDQFELMAATGGRHRTVVQHEMNLRSAYSEIEGKPGSRDERGEPWVTTSHKKFRGTVDYIWHTDDLVTVKVLDTLPTSELPSEKWGSDHLALACEFSFVSRSKDKSISRKAEQESE